VDRSKFRLGNLGFSATNAKYIVLGIIWGLE
jgi:hypothetical protein